MPSRRRSARCAKSAPLTSLPTRRRPFRCCCRRLSRRDRLGVVDAGPSRPSRFIIDLRFAECAAPRRGGSELVGGGGFVTDVHLRSPVRQKACRRGPPAGRAARPAQGMPDMSERWRRGEAARPQSGGRHRQWSPPDEVRHQALGSGPCQVGADWKLPLPLLLLLLEAFEEAGGVFQLVGPPPPA